MGRAGKSAPFRIIRACAMDLPGGGLWNIESSHE
jgi:hypothetical protein